MILHIFALSVKWMMFKNSCKNIEKCRDMYRIQKTIFFSFFFFLQQSAATVVYSFYAIVVTNVT